MRQHFNQALLHQFLRFAVVGVSGTLVQYLTLWTGHGYYQILSAPAASGVGYLLGTVVNYLLNYFFTFGSSKSHREAASKYVSIVGIGWCINFALMGYLINRQGWYYWFAQFLCTGIVLLWNFSGSKWWAFRHEAKA